MTGPKGEDVVPRPASTLVLVRAAEAAIEILLTTRPKHLRFMGGAAVFPGGATADADAHPDWDDLSVLSATEAAEALGDEDPRRSLAAFVCALRESFEEVGLLLAEGPVSGLHRADADDAERFLARCKSLGLELRTDLLTPAGRWVTPLGASVRFDARFFVAEAPAGWIPDPDPSEVERCWWTTPADALSGLGAGTLLMAPPTIEMLQRLDGIASIEDLREAVTETPVGRSGNIISVRLSPLVHVVLAPNPGVMTGPGTNTYIVGHGPVCVIDPAVEDEEYLAALQRAAGSISQVLITHRHPDHIGGAVAVAEQASCPIRAFGSDGVDGGGVDPIADEELIEVGGARLRALHTPGHARDHLAFYLEGAASLFSGDNILGEGTAVIAPPDGNMRHYLQSLERLRAMHIDRIYPGHFRPVDGGRAVIDGYIRHRAERRAAVLDAIAGGSSSIDEIVAAVYRDTPSQLHPVAGLQVVSMLQMLEEDGQVTGSGGRWRAAAVE